MASEETQDNTTRGGKEEEYSRNEVSSKTQKHQIEFYRWREP